jgi:hypothetical protein
MPLEHKQTVRNVDAASRFADFAVDQVIERVRNLEREADIGEIVTLMR